MISRVAESCFWLFRYIERAESCARLVSVNRLLMLDAGVGKLERWKAVIVVLGEQQRYEELIGADKYHDDDTAEEYLTWSDENPVSIRSNLAWARENARMTREVISREMWETLNTWWQWFNSGAAKKEYRKDRSLFYQRIRCMCAEFQGTSDNTMLHEEPLDFMRLGMLIERANQTARLMDVSHYRSAFPERGHPGKNAAPTKPVPADPVPADLAVAAALDARRGALHAHERSSDDGPTADRSLEHPPSEPPPGSGKAPAVETPWQSAHWVSQLKLCAADEPFFKRNRTAPTGKAVAAFLLHDPTFPRSVLHCFGRAEALLSGIEAAAQRNKTSRSLERVRGMVKRLRSADIDTVIQSGLHEELTRVVNTTAQVCDQLHQDFFDPMTEPEAEPLTPAAAAEVGLGAEPPIPSAVRARPEPEGGERAAESERQATRSQRQSQ